MPYLFAISTDPSQHWFLEVIGNLLPLPFLRRYGPSNCIERLFVNLTDGKNLLVVASLSSTHVQLSYPITHSVK